MKKILAILAMAIPWLWLAAPAHADDLFNICGSGRDGVIVGTPTTCAFADNVRVAWLTQPTNPVVAYSPVTNAYYSMTCFDSTVTPFTDGITRRAVHCVGGNNAHVVVW
jgi:hypothetical protein